MNKSVLIRVNLEDNDSQKLDEAFDHVAKTINEHNTKGYKVVSVTPLTASGNFYDNSKYESYGFGFSFTSGIIIVFEKIED